MPLSPSRTSASGSTTASTTRESPGRRTNLEVGGIAQGGSTLTQQYVKNVYLSTEQTFERKISEALLATELEKVMTKEEILFGYLITSYYGSGASRHRGRGQDLLRQVRRRTRHLRSRHAGRRGEGADQPVAVRGPRSGR